MGTITITIDAGAVGAATKTFTIPNAALARFADFARKIGQPGQGGPLTNAQALEKWADWALQMSKAHIMDTERREATIPDLPIG